jgi:hypothetical protein
MTPCTAADGEAAAERLATEHQAIVERLITLEDDLACKLVDSAALEGVTSRRRADVLDGFATLWSCSESYRAAAMRVRAIMERSEPTPADLRAVQDLVTRAGQLAAEIHVLYGDIHEVVIATEAVWTVMAARIDAGDTLLGQAQAVVEDIGLAASQDPAVAVLAQLAIRLNSMRRIALTDPLRLWVGGAVAVAEADQLIAQCEQAHAGLTVLAELRQHGPRRLDDVSATAAEVARLVEKTVQERRRVTAKIAAASVNETMGPSPDLLGPRLAAATELYRCGHWQRLATELPVLERDVAAALRRAQAELIEAGRPLRDRAELRGRLSAYRAKAAGLGRIEDLALDQRYQRARTLLWRAPCDLAAAAAAVAQYQDAVNATATNEDPA